MAYCDVIDTWTSHQLLWRHNGPLFPRVSMDAWCWGVKVITDYDNLRFPLHFRNPVFQHGASLVFINDVSFPSTTFVTWSYTMTNRKSTQMFISAKFDTSYHDDVIKWKHFPRYWPFVRGIHRSRWIPRTKASDAELWYFLGSAPE